MRYLSICLLNFLMDIGTCWFVHQVLLGVYPLIVAFTRKKTHRFPTAFSTGGMCYTLQGVSLLHTCCITAKGYIFLKYAGIRNLTHFGLLLAVFEGTCSKLPVSGKVYLAECGNVS
jgi:hypothetical protein